MSDLPEQAPYPRWYLRYALGLLMVVYAFNFIDRQILVILQEPIKKEMGLTDAQLGLLSGFTFAIFYCTLGLPIARIADRGNRRNVIAWSVALWSMMTAVSGLVRSFPQLLAARIGVGIGEAGASPPAHAIISDYFPPKERPRALGIYSTGIYLGILFGFVSGGWLSQTFGWRTAFWVVGLPGLLVALLVRLTLREPRRGQSEPGAMVEPPLPLGLAIRTLWAMPSFRWMALATGFNAMVTYGTGNFGPSFLARSFHLPLATVGVIGGLENGIGGMLGTYLGGLAAAKLGRNDIRRYLWAPIGAVSVSLVLRLLAYSASGPVMAIAFLAPSDMLAAVFLGPTIAVSHALVRPGLRAFTSAVLLFVMNLIGLGFGPLLTGIVSDRLTPTYGPEALRWALSATSLAFIPAVILYLIAFRALRRDLGARAAALGAA